MAIAAAQNAAKDKRAPLTDEEATKTLGRKVRGGAATEAYEAPSRGPGRKERPR